eukprot:6173712-Pleurochrysis_carterae.AAC.3
MSGTALTEAREFATIYNLDVVDVPPALPLQRVDIPASVYKTTRGKSNAALQAPGSLRAHSLSPWWAPRGAKKIACLPVVKRLFGTVSCWLCCKIEFYYRRRKQSMRWIITDA